MFLSNNGWRSGVDLWITESGIQSEERPGYHPGKGPYYSNDVQASYVMQQYTLAIQGMTNIGRPDGLIFHHRLKDEAYDSTTQLGDGTYGLLRESDNAPWPAYWAAWLITQKLEGATFIPSAGNDVLVDQETAFTPDYKHLVFLGRDGRYIHVLWATRQHATTATFGPVGEGVISGELFRQTQAELYYNGVAPDPMPVINDTFMLGLPAASVESSGGGNDPYRNSDQSIVGGEVYILVESREGGRAPQGGAELVCENGRLIGTRLWGYDEYTGLDEFSYHASPEKTYDLS